MSPVPAVDAPWRACRASPSLALLKYWGKQDTGDTLPATPSLAVTLGGLHTDTWARISAEDSLSVDGAAQDPGRFAQFYDGLRSRLGVPHRFEARSINSFPTAAGLASSSSGFAALAGACARAAGREVPGEEISRIARVGSVSAARSVFGGFVLLPAGAPAARQVFEPSHWPDLRIVVAVTWRGPKPVSSRQAMEETRRSSPYYRSWVSESPGLLPDALQALADRDLEKLGEAARASYTMMHAAMLASRPPILFWLPSTLAVMEACRQMRHQGISAWETVDAGPQVKILCREPEAPEVERRVKECTPGIDTFCCYPGEGIRVFDAPEGEPAR